MTEFGDQLLRQGPGPSGSWGAQREGRSDLWGGGSRSSAAASLRLPVAGRLELLRDKHRASLVFINTRYPHCHCPSPGASPGVWQLRAPSLPCFQAPPSHAPNDKRKQA